MGILLQSELLLLRTALKAHLGICSNQETQNVSQYLNFSRFKWKEKSAFNPSNIKIIQNPAKAISKDLHGALNILNYSKLF